MGQELAIKMLFDQNQSSRISVNTDESDERLRARLQLHIDVSGQSEIEICKSIRGIVSGEDIYKFLTGQTTKYYEATRKAIENYLEKKEDRNFPLENPMFCETTHAAKIGAICSCCKQDSDMGLIVGASGLGKTEKLREMKRRDRSMILVTGDPTARSKGSVLLLISKLLPGISRGTCTNSAFLSNIIDRLKGSGRLVVIDEAHFLSWESFEVMRKIYDSTRVGLVFVGQQSLYDQMKGGSRKSLLWDQIFSRVGIRAHFKGDVLLSDVQMIANKIYPGLDNKSIEYLHAKANGPGKFRAVVKLLQRAQRLAEAEGTKVSLPLLQQVNRILMT
ncbi:MAG: AAA family ATPase [Smithellaceae bacterium]